MFVARSNNSSVDNISDVCSAGTASKKSLAYSSAKGVLSPIVAFSFRDKSKDVKVDDAKARRRKRSGKKDYLVAKVLNVKTLYHLRYAIALIVVYDKGREHVQEVIEVKTSVNLIHGESGEEAALQLLFLTVTEVEGVLRSVD